MQNESTALATRGNVAVATRWRMSPNSLGEAMEMARLIAGSELCPKTYRGKPQDCIIAYEYGAALGLSWMQSLRSISVINGQGALWGDAIPALIYGSSECERLHETFDGEKGTDAYAAVCVMKRRGMPDEVIRRFSVADAKQAGLWGKAGPWQQYSDRMLQMRARGFAARDTFADKLSGLILAEEAQDYPDIEATVVSSEPAPVTVSLLEKLPEPVRLNIETAFETLNMAAGARLAKINEFLGGDGVDLDDGAAKLLDWLRDEFAKRKTGQPRKKKDEGNGKAPKDVGSGSTAAAAATAGAGAPAVSVAPAAVAGSTAGSAAATTTTAPTTVVADPPAAVVAPDDALF